MQILKSVCSFNLLHDNVCSRPSRYWTCFLSVLLQRISRLQMLSICAKTNEKKCEEEWYVTFAWRNSFISSFHLRKPPTNLIDLINPFSAPYLVFHFFLLLSIRFNELISAALVSSKLLYLRPRAFCLRSLSVYFFFFSDRLASQLCAGTFCVRLCLLGRFGSANNFSPRDNWKGSIAELLKYSFEPVSNLSIPGLAKLRGVCRNEWRVANLISGFVSGGPRRRNNLKRKRDEQKSEILSVTMLKPANMSSVNIYEEKAETMKQPANPLFFQFCFCCFALFHISSLPIRLG